MEIVGGGLTREHDPELVIGMLPSGLFGGTYWKVGVQEVSAVWECSR